MAEIVNVKAIFCDKCGMLIIINHKNLKSHYGKDVTPLRCKCEGKVYSLEEVEKMLTAFEANE